MYFDIEKFYDSACLYKLVDHAMAMGFPRRLLYIAMQARLSERILSAGDMVGQSIQPLQRNFGWLLHGKQIREGYLSQDLGQREQRPTRTAARASGDTPVCG